MQIPLQSQLIFSFFKTLTSQPVTIELKNDVAITGTLKSVDQFLNFRIENLRVVGNEAAEQEAAQMDASGQEAGAGVLNASQARWPHLVSRRRKGSRIGLRSMDLAFRN